MSSASPVAVVDRDVEDRAVGPLEVAGAHVGVERVDVERLGLVVVSPDEVARVADPLDATASASRCWRCRRAGSPD